MNLWILYSLGWLITLGLWDFFKKLMLSKWWNKEVFLLVCFIWYVIAFWSNMFIQGTGVYDIQLSSQPDVLEILSRLNGDDSNPNISPLINSWFEHGVPAGGKGSSLWKFPVGEITNAELTIISTPSGCRLFISYESYESYIELGELIG